MGMRHVPDHALWQPWSLSSYLQHFRAGNMCLWKRDFGPEAALCAVRVDPSDARRLCLCGQKGSLIVLRLTNMARDRVEQQTYKVDMSASKPGDALRAVFSTTRDLLYVLLPREASADPPPCASSLRHCLCTLSHAACTGAASHTEQEL